MNIYHYFNGTKNLNLDEIYSREEICSNILTRQRSAMAGDPTPQSLWLDIINLTTIVSRIDAVKNETFSDNVRSKIRTKWWGRQGRPYPSLDLYHEAIAGYLESDDKIDLLDLTPIARILFKEFLRPSAEYLSSRGVIIKDSRTAFTAVQRSPKSSTGWRGLVTETSRDLSILRPCLSDRNFLQIEKLDPYLTWYRDMRNKFRLIFGGTPQHLFVFEKYLSSLLRDMLRCNTAVFYHSEKDESRYIINWLQRVRKWSPKGCVAAVECDYESMDKCSSWKLANKVLTVTIDSLRELGVSISEDEERLVLHALRLFYTCDVIGLDGQVHIVDHPIRTLSGIGPTNGIENLINAYVQCLALANVLEKWYINHECELKIDTLLRVMGDDSALLIACESETLLKEVIEKFLDEFENISTTMGLKIQRQKQAVSFETFCFCRRYYPLTPEAPGFKRYMTGEYRGYPIPVYPVDYALNSLVNPEDKALWSAESSAFPGHSIEEVASLLDKLDNAYGDPAYKTVVAQIANRLKQMGVLETVLDEMALPRKTRRDWRSKVYGAADSQSDYTFSALRKYIK